MKLKRNIMETRFKTGDPLLDDFYPRVENFLKQDQVNYVIDGEPVHGYRSPDCNALWLRDHSDMLRGARYFDPDLQSGATHFAKTQCANGSLFDFVSCAMDRENWTKYVRVPVEADVEYRFVKAIFLGWQASGDDEWLAWILPFAEKALIYSTTHPWRWDTKHGLVKRALTIDTWDFDFVRHDQPWLNFQITDQTHWGIYHCDNSGFYEAFTLMARLNDFLGNNSRAVYWQEQAEQLRQRLNALCWNGHFYRHRFPLDDFRFEGVNEENQLSLSNPMAINRGTTTHEMAVALIQEYQRRQAQTGAFAGWFSIDPPFPDGRFGDSKLVGGAYINGGIFPLAGGELARAAFAHGFEAYGVSIIRQYAKMIKDTNATYLWYFPDGAPSSAETSTSPEATPTDGWGSSAMVYAFVEGLVGVVDHQKLFRQIQLAPRWSAAEINHAEVSVKYGTSESFLAYEYACAAKSCTLVVRGNAAVDCHWLLPAGKRAQQVFIAGERISFQKSKIEQSDYVDFHFILKEKVKIEMVFEK
jgi:hypothetical protein